MPDTKAQLGKRIACLRKNAGLTQEMLAEKTGYSVDFIGLVERGVNSPAVEGLQRFATVFKVRVRDLFEFGDL
jgi:transcriptional regulator with XRE-family HTH domain